MRKPYIGVTGFQTLDEVKEVVSEWSNPQRQLMVGVLTSALSNTDHESEGTVNISVVKKILNYLSAEHRSDVFLALHYYPSPRKEELDNFEEQIVRAVSKEAPVRQVFKLVNDFYFHWTANREEKPEFGIQFNNGVPILERESVRKHYSALRIIAPFPRMPYLDQDKARTASRFTEDMSYLADDVLFDPSRSEGKEFSLEDVKIVNANCGSRADVLLGIAGGFDEDNVAERVRNVIETIGHNNFSIDAERRLHTEGRLDLDKVRNYLRNAQEAFR